MDPGAQVFLQIQFTLQSSVENLKKSSSERVQPAPIYWRYIPKNTNNKIPSECPSADILAVYTIIKEAPTKLSSPMDFFLSNVVFQAYMTGARGLKK